MTNLSPCALERLLREARRQLAVLAHAVLVLASDLQRTPR